MMHGTAPRAIVSEAEFLRLPESTAKIELIEVLSEDRVHDRVTKRLLYAAAGVKENWVVEPAGLVERWSGPGLTRAETLRARVRTALLPGFALDLRRPFATKAS